MGYWYKILAFFDMKKITAYIGAAALFFMLGCDNTNFDCVKKAGDNTTVALSLPPFHSININDGINVILKTGNSQEISLTAGKNLIPGIKLSVDEDGFLNIYNENSCNWVRTYRDINLHLTLDTLSHINHYGFGLLSSDGVVSFNKFSVNIKDGTGDVRLKIDNESLQIVNNSFANCFISGQTHNFSVGHYYNDGICQADELSAKRVSINHLGTNTIAVNPSESLTGSLQSSGDIVYRGDPQNIDVKVTGTGKLRKQ